MRYSKREGGGVLSDDPAVVEKPHVEAPPSRWLIALITSRPEDCDIEYQQPGYSSQEDASPFSTSHPSEAILKHAVGDDLNGALDRIVVVSTDEHLNQFYAGENATLRELMMTWTGVSSLPSDRIHPISVGFSDFDIMKLWGDINKYMSGCARPPGEIIADLSGIGAHHTTALSRILKIYSMLRRLNDQEGAQAVKLKVFSTTVDRDSLKEEKKGWIIDQGVLDPIEDFSRAVYEFTNHADPEPLIDRIKNLRGEKKFEAKAHWFINLIRDFSARMREGLPFTTKFHQDKHLLNLLQGFEDGIARTKPELAEIIDSAVQLIRSLLQAQENENLLLDMEELKRLVLFAEQLVIQGSLSHALRIYREVVVCRILLEQGKNKICQNGNWLERDHRIAAEAIFNFVHRSHQGQSPLKEKFPANCQILDGLMDDRNHVAHSGFNRNEIPVLTLTENYQDRKRALRTLLLEETDFWKEVVKCEVSGHLLLTPFGESTGVLTTLLENLNGETAGYGPPLDGVVIVTSKRCSTEVASAIEASPFYSKREGFQVIQCLLDSQGEDIHTDPIGMATEDLQSATDGTSIMEILLASSRITVNYTGGLSSMGILIDRLARELDTAVGRDVAKVICVDRRTASEKQDQPFAIGKIKKIEISMGTQ
jgi:hypothetical protein